MLDIDTALLLHVLIELVNYLWLTLGLHVNNISDVCQRAIFSLSCRCDTITGHILEYLDSNILTPPHRWIVYIS